MKDQSNYRGRLWKYTAVACLLVPICGFIFATYGPTWVGRPYYWIYAILPIAGGIGGIAAIAAMIGLRIRRLRGWAWVCSILGLLASGAAVFFGAIGLFVATVFGPVYISASYITAQAGLANVPASASGVEGLHRNGQGDRWYFLTFKAPAADIETFVRGSASIRQPPHTVFDANNVYIPFRLPKDKMYDMMMDDRRYLAYLNGIPWFRPDITVKGRLFDFETKDQWGTIVIDDSKNEVYVFLAWK
jgi:hypothetical protein